MVGPVWLVFSLARVRLTELARALHAECGADVSGMGWERLYLPQTTAFGWFRGRLLHEIDGPAAHHLADGSQATYLGFRMDWVTGYAGWIPFAGAKVELNPDGDCFDVVLSFTPGVLPVLADAERFLNFVRILREAGAVYVHGKTNETIDDILGAGTEDDGPAPPPLPPDGCVRGW